MGGATSNHPSIQPSGHKNFPKKNPKNYVVLTMKTGYLTQPLTLLDPRMKVKSTLEEKDTASGFTESYSLEDMKGNGGMASRMVKEPATIKMEEYSMRGSGKEENHMDKVLRTINVGR